MRRFWGTVIEPVLEALQPRSIVETASDRGFNTRTLLEYWREATRNCTSLTRYRSVMLLLGKSAMVSTLPSSWFAVWMLSCWLTDSV